MFSPFASRGRTVECPKSTLAFDVTRRRMYVETQRQCHTALSFGSEAAILVPERRLEGMPSLERDRHLYRCVYAAAHRLVRAISKGVMISRCKKMGQRS